MKTDSSSAASRGNRLFLTALASASFASGPISVLGALLLIDIGNTFGTSVGVTGQIYTLYSVAAVIFALLTGALSVKFEHRSLLLTGLFLMAVSAAGCFLALDFITFVAFYSLSGAGYAIVNPMAFTLIGEHFPMEKRANVIGLIVAGGALVYVIGAPLIALMSGYAGWRFPFLGFVLPILLISLLLAFLGLPSTPNKRQVPSEVSGADPSPKPSLLHRSAIACLIGDTLRSAAFVAIVLYATSFFRQRFLVPTDSASLILLGGALSYVLGSLMAGRFVNMMGRKSSAVVTALLSGAFTVSFVFVPNVWISLILMLIASWFFGMVASSANSLILEQTSELKGTLMSIDTAVLNAGSAFGTTTGGLALLYFGYQGLGSVLGTIGIVAALIFFLLAKDPTKPP